MRILILEDNLILASGLSDKLTSAGYAVDVLHDGEDGNSVLALTYRKFGNCARK